MAKSGIVLGGAAQSASASDVWLFNGAQQHCRRLCNRGRACDFFCTRLASSLRSGCVTDDTVSGQWLGQGVGEMQANEAYPCRRTALPIVVLLWALGTIAGPASAQQPTTAQKNALRSACVNDFMAHCSKVNPNGPGALACLQRNAASLSPRCRSAMSAVGGGSAPAGAQTAARPAASSAQPGAQQPGKAQQSA